MENYSELRDKLGRGDRVLYEIGGDEYSGTVCKSNRGGIRVLLDSGSTLHVIKTGGMVTKTHPDGGALRITSRVGRASSLRATGETAGVEYEQRAGWTHTEEELPA